jgi:formylglycine-generating enzyme required for sulfatase activity
MPGMKIFISYRRAEDDKSYIVGTIHKILADTFGKDEVFRDKDNIAGGADWREVLGREISSCRVMLVIIGPDWASLTNPDGQKRLDDPNDVTRWEVETGLKRSAEGAAAVIPVLVTGAKVPKTDDLPPILRPLLDKNVVTIRNYPDFDRDMEDLISDTRGAMGYAADDLEIDESYEPRTVYIAKGQFQMGSDTGDESSRFEKPHPVTLPAYRIGIAPVTNAQYKVFVQATTTRVLPIMGWVGQVPRDDRLDFPVAGITFREALTYCDWLSQKSGRGYTIPNEAQWEKACRAGSTSRFPWGDDPDPNRSNHGKQTLASINAYLPQNIYGMQDLVGNVRQWTTTLWGKSRVKPDENFLYPWRQDAGRNDVNASLDILRVIRGCSFAEDALNLRCAARKGQLPGDAGWIGAGIGFRVAINL